MKKILSMVMAMVLLISILPMNVLAEGTTKITVDGMEFLITDGEATLYKCNNTLVGEVVIPAYVDEYPVVLIGELAFLNSKKVTAVSFPETIKSIGNRVFSGLHIEKISIKIMEI